MVPIENQNARIFFKEQGYKALNEILLEKKPSSIFILVDENSMEHCYPIFMGLLETTARIEVIEIEAGEQFKTIETCSGVWAALVELGCDRASTMINLGGGVITDLGGFVASTIKRGIDFIHVPTTVLAMVDAAVGGKNGVDLGHLKNQIGTINPPLFTLVDTEFLSTLPQNHLINGSIEMFKHGLIADRAYWKDMIAVGEDYLSSAFDNLIHRSVVIKSTVVASDPFEKGARKSLNYGHTIGHAIESFCLSSDDHRSLLHGEAIAVGLYLESYLSCLHTDLSQEDFKEIEDWFLSLNIKVSFKAADLKLILEIMSHDKKNVGGELRFVLITEIGNYKVDQAVSEADVLKAFELLNS
jgi:3-dehydroquinate synthase